MNEFNDSVDKSYSSNESSSKHLIEDKLFQDILALREEIYQATEINVSVRKLVNMLLKQSDFKSLGDKLIQQYS